MPFEVKQFNCPQCGSPLDIQNAARSKTIVCPACGSQIDLVGPEHRVTGNVGSRPTPQLTPFRVGMRGTIGGEEHQVIGRVLYRDDEGYTWDEWLLLTAAGEYRWLSDDPEEGMVLWRAFTPIQPVDPNTVRQGMSINLSGTPARVTEVGRATIAYLEGELTWRAGKGEVIGALDAEGPDGLYSIEWSADEIEFYRGQRLNQAEVARAFGLASSVSSARNVNARLATVIIAAIVILMVCICVASAMGASLAVSNDCLSTPEAVRSSDCTTSGGVGWGGTGSSGGGGGGK